ncbi:conserved hypothetical protein [Neospora caninum Liverpool]|uniref:Uncharacterized protein n=1 Tax=Neospora caninum (strain Liverpool) TaxID=572307 RepID=F0V7U4_NEOCL|nr:conserved hypothetical protein [Neospora caninum Liverpool]CBZ49785.1 conserved hypothetical protein [Neospora caninum Liverpool]CEL64373.1 TPA: hypothetical protein BN1204_002730 [Neospora caninum Liverpool]|eukprot:XP_003879820.1 conserved hypothetical protein [Neospora caninum Liverpool]
MPCSVKMDMHLRLAILSAVGCTWCVFICNGQGVTRGAMPEPAAGTPATQSAPVQESETEELPKVDVEMVPGRRYKTSRRALIKLKQRFKQFIHDEISKVAHEYDQQLNAVSPPTGETRLVNRSPIEVYEKMLGTPPAITHPLLKASTQQRFQAIQEHDASSGNFICCSGPRDANASLEALSSLFEANKFGATLDMQQDATTDQYLEALAQGLEQQVVG